MANEVIQRMQHHLDAMTQGVPGENIEFWYARDLQEPLGYARWENFMTAIRRAMEACESTGYSVDDHFRGVTKMVPLGSGAERLATIAVARAKSLTTNFLIKIKDSKND